MGLGVHSFGVDREFLREKMAFDGITINSNGTLFVCFVTLTFCAFLYLFWGVLEVFLECFWLFWDVSGCFGVCVGFCFGVGFRWVLRCTRSASTRSFSGERMTFDGITLNGMVRCCFLLVFFSHVVWCVLLCDLFVFFVRFLRVVFFCARVESVVLMWSHVQM